MNNPVAAQKVRLRDTDVIDQHHPALERKLNAYYAEFNPVTEGKGQAHQHGGAEFIYLLEGKLSLKIKDDEHVMEAGDSIYFDSSVPHSDGRIGKPGCTALVVTVP